MKFKNTIVKIDECQNVYYYYEFEKSSKLFEIPR